MEKEYYIFYKELGQKYPEEAIVYKSLRGFLRRKFVMQYINNWKGSLLDIGCNRGMYLEKFTEGFAVGVDISFQALQYAVKRCAKNPNKSYCVLGNAEELSFIRDNSFNHILCSELLEHVYKPEKVISEISRILKPNGTVLITVPNYTRQKPTWIEIGNLENYGVHGIKGNKYYHTAFKPGEIQKMVEAVGLQVITKGTLEKEVRYAVKIPVLFYFLFETFNNIFIKSKTFSHWNSKTLDKIALVIYNIAGIMKIDPMLQKIFREGARTFLYAKKLE